LFPVHLTPHTATCSSSMLISMLRNASCRWDVSKLEPLVAAPHSPDNRKTARECSDVKIDRVYIGSCTGASGWQGYWGRCGTHFLWCTAARAAGVVQCRWFCRRCCSHACVLSQSTDDSGQPSL
jgi:hypothetical protein